jgi:hypothetical protein
MAQGVRPRPLTAEARFRVQVNPCGICGGESGTGTGFSPSSLVFLVNIIRSSIHIVWGMNNMSVRGSSSET